jgi:hypothetical protein
VGCRIPTFLGALIGAYLLQPGSKRVTRSREVSHSPQNFAVGSMVFLLFLSITDDRSISQKNSYPRIIHLLKLTT